MAFALFMALFTDASAQCKEFMIGINGDTLNCVDAGGQKQGRWVERVEQLRGEPGFEEEGEYKNGQKTGAWKKFSLHGDLLAIENYRYGHKHSQQQYFSQNGNLSREESWLSSNPENPYETVEVYDLNEPGKIQLVQVKMEASTVPHGVWKLYDEETGKLIEKKNFILGKEDDGSGTGNGLFKKDQSETVKKNETAEPEKKEKPKPKEVLNFEKSNEGKKKIKVRTGQTGG